MATLDTAAIAAVLKQQYTQNKVHLMTYPDNPLYALIRKKTDFVGSNKVIALRTGVPQSRSATFATGNTNPQGGTYNRFTLTRVKDYAFANLTGEAIEASAKDAGSLLQTLKSEIDGAIYVCMRSMATAMYRNGGGARGQISAASNTGTATITLSNPTDITNFEVNMTLQTSTADGTSGAVKSGTVFITALDRDLGTLTASGNWTAGIATAAAGDFIFQSGDFGLLLSGLAAWVPPVAPTSTPFFGLDRSTDVTRLGGIRYTANAGGAIEETLIETAARVAREGGKSDIATLNPLDYSILVKALGAKVIYDRAMSIDEPDIGFDAVKLMGPKGPIKVIADLNCPKGIGWMLQSNTWNLETLNGAPRILDLDGNRMLRSSTEDSYQIRIGYYGNMSCEAPGFNAYFQL